jgi:hypothetical protein
MATHSGRRPTDRSRTLQKHAGHRVRLQQSSSSARTARPIATWRTPLSRFRVVAGKVNRPVDCLRSRKLDAHANAWFGAIYPERSNGVERACAR